MNSVRWGLLSTANINRKVIPAIHLSAHGELTAVASRSQESADTYARKWEIPMAYPSYESMLKSGKVDAVYISLPNHLHAEWTIKALEHGVHVLCEKPFALTLDEVDAMIAASKANKRILAEAFMYRHHPQTKIIGEWAHNGKLGELLYVNSTFNFFLSNRDNVRLVKEYGGGSLWDVGVYPVSFAQYIFQGPPKWVSGSQLIGDSGVEERFGGLLHYENDGHAVVNSSFLSPYYTSAEVIGTKGRLIATRPFNNLDETRRLTFYSREGDVEEIPVPEEELYLGEVEDMEAAILEGAPNYLSLDETRNHVKTVIALYEAARTRSIVELK